MRLLIWNIERFTLKRISDSSGPDAMTQQDNQDRSAQSLGLILTTVKQADPDVFVVLEPLSSRGPINQLASGEGAAGLGFLCEQLRSLSMQWHLVPPLRANPDVLDSRTYTETVGVFWRNDRVKFRGPLVWPQGPDGRPSPTGPPIEPGTGAAAAAYPDPWNTVMPADGDGNKAAWVALVPGANPNPTIGAPPTNRQPYITDFYEGSTNRTIRLFSVHLPPNQTAGAALLSITGLPNAVWQPPPNGVSVIAGDMNIDLANPNLLETAYLTQMNRERFGVLIPYPRPGPRVAFSMLEPIGVATTGAYLKGHLYDYGLARYGSPPPSRTFRAVVADRVVGVQAVAAAGEAPLQTFGTDMVYSVEELDTLGPVESANEFRRRPNYGHLRETSDHIATLMVV